ncbi:hypothetical protein ROS1_07770 [Roseibium sp. ROS1]
MKYVWVPDRRAAALRLSGMTGGCGQGEVALTVNPFSKLPSSRPRARTREKCGELFLPTVIPDKCSKAAR